MKKLEDMSLTEKIVKCVDNAYDDLLEMLKNETIEEVREFVQEMKVNNIYSSLDYIRQRILAPNVNVEEGKLYDKIMKILVAVKQIEKGEDKSTALYSLTR